MQSLETLNTSYKRLFDKEDRGSKERVIVNRKGFERWGWIITLDNLSNSRPETWEHYYKMGVIEFLNLCAYFKDKAKEQERQINIQKMRNSNK